MNRHHSPSFLIVETGQPVAPMRRYGGFPHWIRVAAGLSAGQARVVNVEAGEPLPEARGHAGVIVTGSAAMVTDRHPWSERTADWLREAVDRGLPYFGICYGHQLLAHALGGEVGDNPAGREMGPVDVELHPEAAQDGCQSFRWGEHAWGVQFHPEFSTAHMRGYVHARRDALRREGRCPRQLTAAVAAAPHARRVLRRFVAHAARRHDGGHAPASSRPPSPRGPHSR